MNHLLRFLKVPAPLDHPIDVTDDNHMEGDSTSMEDTERVQTYNQRNINM